MTVDDLIERLGGNKVVAHELGAGPSAVSMWRQRGEIPARHHFKLWRRALENGLDWEPPGAAELWPLLDKERAERATRAA